MIIPLALLLALAAPSRAQTVDWSHDSAARIGAQVAEARRKSANTKDDGARPFSAVDAPDSTQLTPDQLACQPDVIAGFKKIFEDSGSGTRNTEAGLRIDLVDGKRLVIVADQTNEFKRTEIPIMRSTIAIAHTHPENGAGAGAPSQQDETSPVPNFVVTRWALWVTIPNAAKHHPHSRRVRYDWMKPCEAGQ